MLIWGIIPSLELQWGVTGRTPLLQQLGAFLPMPEVLLHRIQDGLADLLGHCIIMGTFSQQPPQLIHITIDVSHICSEHPKSDKIYGRNFHLQIPFRGGLPPTLANGPTVYSLTLCDGMAEHPIENVGPLQALWPPLQELIKEDISIQLPFWFPYQYTFFVPQSFSSNGFLCLAFVA